LAATIQSSWKAFGKWLRRGPWTMSQSQREDRKRKVGAKD